MYFTENAYPWRTGPLITGDTLNTGVVGKPLPVDWVYAQQWNTTNSPHYALLCPGVGRLSYWHPLKTNAFHYELPKNLAYDSSTSTGPIGVAPVGYTGVPQGGVPAPVSMSDAFWGTGFQLIQPIASNLVSATDWSSVYNNANTTKSAYTSGLAANSQGVYLNGLTSNPMIYGLAKPFNDNFCGSAMEPVFSTSILSHYIKEGLPTATNYVAQSFKIPVMLGLIGHFIRKENYRLIPMEIFEGCTLEFTMNPTYLFTSNHTTNQQNRNYNLSNVYLEMETMIILDSGID